MEKKFEWHGMPPNTEQAKAAMNDFQERVKSLSGNTRKLLGGPESFKARQRYKILCG